MKRNRLLFAGLVVAAPALASADPVGGAACTSDIVHAESSVTFTIPLRGAELTRVDLRGDGDTDLDLHVYDAFGNLVDWNTNYIDRASVTFRPRWTGDYDIQVTNLGGVYNRFRMCAY